ncbi:septal ring lytic transglycosylase RlpA family protein [Microvenator marinus]|jgi:rare lipoprotein A|uniref:Probable endolytic peptidoglycan transglycosylase RlpA n=1 Tax=Microvenator marinus TaxID=2600177 RepID=A0A5B8XNY0_9DELT|nr:septal ring lytic transglycosylase RlpA family protein [Microvenator marinus]QED26951.1 septal ring lytic transglycosylase RlpA family protein [Microvenator marinus]
MRVLLFLGALVLVGCGPTRPDSWIVGPNGKEHELLGKASWYGPGFEGRKTASGEIFDPREMTAAHKTLPFGTIVRVVASKDRKSVVVRINDRGPFSAGRVIDLSKAAAEDIGMIRAGVIDVHVEVLDWP